MQYGITIPFQKYLKRTKPSYGEPVDLFFCWEVHKIKFEGKNMFIAVNASNRFAVAMMHLKPSDWKSLDVLMEDAITKGMLSEGFSIEEIHQYLDMAGEVEITKTHGRKPVSGLNRAVEYLYHFTREEVSDDRYQEELCAEVNRELCSAAGFKGYGIPYERMWEDMKRVGIVRRE